MGFVVALIILGVEIFTYFSLLTAAERLDRGFSYIAVRILVPTLLNFTTLIVTSFFLKSKKAKTDTKNFMVSLTFFTICSVVSIFHNYFQILMLSSCIPFYLCTIFGDIRILKRLAVGTVFSFIIATITFAKEPLVGVPIYKIITIVCAMTFISCSYVFSWSIVNSQKDQLKYISNIYQRQTELIEELRIDPLTKLCNRKAFSETITRIVNCAKTTEIHPYIVMMDIDFFKKVNDKYGHISGDEVLMTLSNIMRNAVSARKAFRYGGEEFVLLFENDTCERVVNVVEQIRKEFSQTRYDFAPDESFTISAGISALTGTFNEKEWLENADKALYFAKENGRDQIKIAN